MEKLYRNIRQRRRELKMTQQELAEKIGYVDRSSIAKIESGIVDLSQSKIIQIARALDMNPSDLMGEVEYDDCEDETIRIVSERLRTNPEYAGAFTALASVRPEDVEVVTIFIERLLK